MNESEVDTKKIKVINLFLDVVPDNLGCEGLREVLTKVDDIPIDRLKTLSLFNCEKIPGDDEQLLKNLLSSVYGTEWVGSAEITKSNNGRTIYIKNDKDLVKIKINDDYKIATLEINNQIKCEMGIEMKDNERVIYLYYEVITGIMDAAKETMSDNFLFRSY